MTRYLILALLILKSGFCRTKGVEFKSPKTADTAALHVGQKDQGNLYNDSLVVTAPGKDSLVFFAYTAEAGNAFCDGVRSQAGLALRAESGTFGRGGPEDTVWESANAFPDSLGKLDSIPGWGFAMAGEDSFGSKYLGALMGTATNSEGICTYPIWSLSRGYNRIVYYGSKGMFGKIQIYASGDTTTIASWGGPLKSYNRIYVRYLFSSDKSDLIAPLSAIRKPRQGRLPVAGFFPVPERDMLGRRK